MSRRLYIWALMVLLAGLVLVTAAFMTPGTQLGQAMLGGAGIAQALSMLKPPWRRRN